jgi:DNA-binding transcriptional LysR family regulator
MTASAVRLGAIDLNLLVVLDAVMQERSVTRAGRQLGMSQSAMSHALRRLRHMTGDDLFVRTPQGMVPTPHAQELAPAVRMALSNLQRSLEKRRFAPETATDVLRIAVDNYSSAVIVGRLVARIGESAPGVRLDIRPSGRIDLSDLLDRHELDLVIGCHTAPAKRFSYQRLMHDRFVVMLNKDHPVLREGPLTMERLAALKHVEVTSDILDTSFVDEALARHQLHRRIALRTPFISTVRVVTTCDMATIFPERVATDIASFRPLAVLPLPFPSPTLEWGMVWPRWLDRQPAQVWLRENIAATMGP